MNKRLQRLLALAMGLALLVSALAGCGGSGSSDPAVSNSEATTNAERQTVNIRFSQYANSTDDAEGMANDPIKKAIEEAVNITLEYDTGIRATTTAWPPRWRLAPHRTCSPPGVPLPP